ncbi:hypothetical protein ACERK3_13125 [Phycisphaerales bacterium AB-hyl4]|uniref:Uncharacterized protein n=1 Tax=Natronomicrosphaera hydrolytica TaxID=3242702 RepID=A0ABV4U7F1_9BACT
MTRVFIFGTVLALCANMAAASTVYHVRSEWEADAHHIDSMLFRPVSEIPLEGLISDGLGSTIEYSPYFPFRGRGRIYGDGFLAMLESGDSRVTIRFDQPVRGFAADIVMGYNQVVPLRFTVPTSDDWYAIPRGATFFGFLAEGDQLFDEVIISNPLGQANIEMRNVQVDGVLLPTPAAYMGGGILLAFLGLFHWMRKRSACETV